MVDFYYHCLSGGSSSTASKTDLLEHISKKEFLLRALIFHPALAPYRVDLFNSLASRCQLKVIFLRENLLNQKFDQEALKSQLVVDYSYLTRGFTILARSFRFGVGAQIRAFNPDVVVTHEFSPMTMAVCFQRKISRKPFRHVIWSADNPVVIAQNGVVKNFLRKYVLPRVDGLVLYTNEIANLYRTQFRYSRPIGVVPNIPWEMRFRSKLAESTSEAIEAIQCHQLTGKKIILYVGRLSHEKRIDRLIKAFANLTEEDGGSVLVLVGDGNERRALELLVQELGINHSVIFVGRLEGAKLAAWYRIGSVFALTSESETFGAVVNEALLAGMPVVCSSKAGARVLIREGENGSVVDPENREDLQKALKHWLGQCPPISIERLLMERPSLMPIRFENAVEAFVQLLKSVTQSGVEKQQC